MQSIIESHIVPYYVNSDSVEAPAAASIAVPHILRHHAPVVMHLGKRKAITINGDIKTLDGSRRALVF